MNAVADVEAFDQKTVANPEARKLDSYPHLDWLRFVLASIVALGHEGMAFFGPIDGGMAVSVFLALSGWLIGGILIRSTAGELPRFFFNRATRIWIPYAATAALIYALAAARDGIDANWWKYLFYDATFTHYTFTIFPRATVELPLGGTANHFWSISVEEQFYLLAPLAMFLLPRGKSLWLWGVLVLATALISMTFLPIALGVAAAIAQRDHGDWHARGIGRALVVGGAIALLAAAWRWDMPLLRGLLALAIVLALAMPGPRHRLGLLLGAISYPLYLNHWIGGFVAHAVEKRMPLAPGVGIALAYAIAVAAGFVAWAAIDRIVMARRAGWFTPALGKRLAIAAYSLFFIGLIGGTAIHIGGG